MCSDFSIAQEKYVYLTHLSVFICLLATELDYS